VIQAAAYLRVSGLGQIEGDGFPRQREAVSRYARSNDIEIVAEFRDEGVSGTLELENRAGLAACLEYLETSGVKLVIVESSDRLARDSVVAELIVRQFQKAGARVVSASGGVDLTAGDSKNPTAKLIRQLLAVIAEFDKAVITLRLKAARDRQRKETGRCEGPKPYGSLYGEDIFLGIMRELRAKGNDDEAIAKRMNFIGVPTRKERRWHAATIYKILARDKTSAQDVRS